MYMKKLLPLYLGLLALLALIIGLFSVLAHESEQNELAENISEDTQLEEVEEIADPKAGNEIEIITQYSNASADDIIVSNPLENSAISSPLTISGQARGTWFFEARADVELLNWDGSQVANGYIETLGPWTTEDFVDFEGSLTFTSPNNTINNTGVLIIKNANPSGDAIRDKSIAIPVQF